jgi:hypothetical protein
VLAECLLGGHERRPRRQRHEAALCRKRTWRDLKSPGTVLLLPPLARAQRDPSIISAHFSPIMMHVALVLPETTVGMIEASATRKASRPCTRSQEQKWICRAEFSGVSDSDPPESVYLDGRVGRTIGRDLS